MGAHYVDNQMELLEFGAPFSEKGISPTPHNDDILAIKQQLTHFLYGRCLRFIDHDLRILRLSKHFVELCGKKSARQSGVVDGKDIRAVHHAPSQAPSLLGPDEPLPPTKR
jgi:hypothetical protein